MTYDMWTFYHNLNDKRADEKFTCNCWRLRGNSESTHLYLQLQSLSDACERLEWKTLTYCVFIATLSCSQPAASLQNLWRETSHDQLLVSQEKQRGE